MNGIQIYGQNFIDEHCGFTFYYDAGAGEIVFTPTASPLYDQDQATQWLGEHDADTTDEFIDIVFKNWQGEEVERTIDRIVMLNHNLKEATAYYWTGSAWAAISGAAITDEDEDHTILSFTALATSRLRMKLEATQTENQFKVIGELKACRSILTDPRWDSDFSRNDDESGDSYRLAEGPLVIWREWTKPEGTLTLNEVSLSDLTEILPYMKAASFLTVVFHDDFDLGETYEFAISNAPRLKLDRKTELYSVTLNLRGR